MLGVHPNTVRAWSDQGRLRYYRINARGDRRYRIADLQRFLDAAEREGRPGLQLVTADRSSATNATNATTVHASPEGPRSGPPHESLRAADGFPAPPVGADRSQWARNQVASWLQTIPASEESVAARTAGPARTPPMSRVERREQARRTPPRRVGTMKAGRRARQEAAIATGEVAMTRSGKGMAAGPVTAGAEATTAVADPTATRPSDLTLLTELAEAAIRTPDLDRLMGITVARLRAARGWDLVEIWEACGDEFACRAGDGSGLGWGSAFGSDAIRWRARSEQRPILDDGVAAASRSAAGPGSMAGPRSTSGPRSVAGLPARHFEAAAPIRVDNTIWGVLQVGCARRGRPSDANADANVDADTTVDTDSNVDLDVDLDVDLLVAIAGQLGMAIHSASVLDEVSQGLRRAEALRRVAADIGAELGFDESLARLIDHALVLFEADRGAIFLCTPDNRASPEVSRGLSEAYLRSAGNFLRPSLPAAAIAAHRPMFATNYRDDPRAAQLRAAIVQEGFDTICSAPMFLGEQLLGVLNLYHDRHHTWTAGELESVAAFAGQATTLLRSAQQFGRLALWAGQLQSIQRLGARLNHLTAVDDICDAIATELREVIAHDNIRVYRSRGEELFPVALRGSTPAYEGETAQDLTLRVGQGITGWVAAEGRAQNLPDAAHDPRAAVIPGTEPMAESMLLAPLVFERRVLGVIVLSRHGLAQFGDDDLRLLEIYASFAAQAAAHAEATERLREQSATLERQLRSQRAVLSSTESILTTLDPRAVLGQIAERLGVLVGYDNLAIEMVDPVSRQLTPLMVRGVHAAQFMEPRGTGERGLATWVVEHNEPVLVLDERNDARANVLRGGSAIDGSLIVVPLRGRDGATGVLTLERLGTTSVYSHDEFELVKLFAARVSIALQNAEIYRAVEIRARTDDLTGLLNHGTFREWLREGTARDEPFCLLMIDLDDFKVINDAFGHPAGDRLLRQIGAAIGAAGREHDVVFRYGGDEFAVLAPGADHAGGMRIAERVLEAIHAVSGHGAGRRGAEVEFTASIGVASYPSDATTGESILLAADRACFLAKRTGRNRIASATEGLAVGEELSLHEPTPVDPPTLTA